MEKPDRRNMLKFYGRRKGKALKQNRQSAYDLVMPAVQITLPDGDAPLSPAGFFDFPVKDVWLEVGFGNGEQLVHQALENPDIGMIGCEPFLNGVSALCRDISDKGIKNIRIWQDDARVLLPRMLSKSISRCFVLNSDPWPKTRHHKRRFIQKETLDELHRLLKTGAELRLSSDDPSLNAWQMEKPYFHGGYEWLAHCADDWRSRPADMLGTRYQAKGQVQGRATVFLNFKTI
jgi:tRNA (guanine-N7-)-methyltransferase